MTTVIVNGVEYVPTAKPLTAEAGMSLMQRLYKAEKAVDDLTADNEALRAAQGGLQQAQAFYKSLSIHRAISLYTTARSLAQCEGRVALQSKEAEDLQSQLTKMLVRKDAEIQRLKDVCNRIGKLAAGQPEVNSNLLRFILRDSKYAD